MGEFRFEFRFPRKEEGLDALKAFAENPKEGQRGWLDEGEVTLVVDGQPVLPPWRYEPNQTYTGFD